MAPFTNRQIGYIRAISGKSKHKSFIVSNINNTVSLNVDELATSAQPQNFTGSKSLTVAHWALNELPQGLDARTVNVSNDFTTWVPEFTSLGCGQYLGEMRLLHCPVDDTAAGENRSLAGYDHQHFNKTISTTEYRVSDDCFLDSTHMTLRFTMPDLVPQGTEANHTASMHTPHYEWRLIIFRNKRKTYRRNDSVTDTATDQDGQNNTLGQLMDGVSLANHGYDLFMGQAGRPRGFIGWRQHPVFDEYNNITGDNLPVDDDYNRNHAYAGKYWNGTAWTDGLTPQLAPPGEDLMTADDYLTFRLNKNDYVIHTDERFFLGQQFGKSHYEKTIHFDWKDFIDTHNANLCSSPTLDKKNYEWQFLLLGTSNGSDNAELNVSIRATTAVTSGM